MRHRAKTLSAFSPYLLHTFACSFSYFRRLWSASLFKMDRTMFLLIKDFKILQSIVSYIAIDVMDFFGTLKKTTQMFFHYKTMFQNIMFMSIRMIGAINLNISIRVNKFPTLPKGRLFSRLLGRSRMGRWASMYRMSLQSGQGITFEITPRRQSIFGNGGSFVATAFA